MHNAITGGAPHGIMPHAPIGRLRRLPVGALVTASVSWVHSGATSSTLQSPRNHLR